MCLCQWWFKEGCRPIPEAQQRRDCRAGSHLEQSQPFVLRSWASSGGQILLHFVRHTATVEFTSNNCMKMILSGGHPSWTFLRAETVNTLSVHNSQHSLNFALLLSLVRGNREDIERSHGRWCWGQGNNQYCHTYIQRSKLISQGPFWHSQKVLQWFLHLFMPYSNTCNTHKQVWQTLYLAIHIQIIYLLRHLLTSPKSLQGHTYMLRLEGVSN